MIDGNKVTIGFTMKHAGNKYKAKSTFEVYEGSILDEIGEMFNTFLKQAGYTRENDYILMNDVTLDELQLLEAYLAKIRKENQQ